MSGEVLVDAPAFMAHLKERALRARRSFFVQAMTFEGDAAGKQLIEIMKSSPAKDKRLCVDSYSKAVVNDHFVFGSEYFRSAAFRHEVKETKRVLLEAEKVGIRVKFTNSIGWKFWRYPCRNHKKMVVLDEETVYLGGINFSDHNFAWHDCMLALTDSALGQAIAEDFHFTWAGKNQSGVRNVGGHQLFLLNGAHSKREYQELFALIAYARKSITFISPYISNPLLHYLHENLAGGVDVKVISPAENNKSIFKHYLFRELKKRYFRLFLYRKGMSHLKAVVLDDETLVIGSSNLDFASYYFEQEVVLVLRDAELIKRFKEKVVEPDLALSEELPERVTYNKLMAALARMVPLACFFLSKMGLRPNDTF